MSELRRPRAALKAASLTAAAMIASAVIAAGPAPPASAAGSHHEPANFKKGVGAWSFRKVRVALEKSGASWYYTWAVNHPGIRTPKGVSFVPMIWGAGAVTAKNLKLVRHEGRNLLTFNEPDLSAQANMTVKQALHLWPRLEATKMRLGSPAVAFDAATPGSWLVKFMSRAKQRHYRVDFITLHWYGSDFSTGPAVSQLRSYLQAVYDRYHKPIWLTEFGLANFGTGQFPAAAQQAAFVTAATTMLDGLPYLQRYAWFALPANSTDGSLGLFTSSGAVTSTGRAFEAAGRS